jgi:hypothetical protein
MSAWRKLVDLVPTSGGPFAPPFGALQHAGEPPRVPMRPSAPIEIDGVFLGAAVEHELGVRFIAADDRVTAMDQSIWPTLEYASCAARQLFKSGCLAEPG